MTALFLHPPLQTMVSGGNVYNQHIIQQALANNYPLRSFPIEKAPERADLVHEIAHTKARLIVWDSLFFDILSKSCAIEPPIATAVLVHYLPSLNPACCPTHKKKLERMENDAIHNCSRVICTGSTTYQAVSARCPGKPLFLCEPGVDDFFRPPPIASLEARDKDCVDLISVANLLPEKGYFELLDALSDLKTDRWIWHIVGSGHADRSFSARFRSSALAANLAPRIRLHGIVHPKRLALLLSEMDLFVSASYYESYGMAIAEAVATGLPVIATRTGAIPELIEDQRSGFLVPSGDRNSLKYALEKLIRNPELRKAFGVKARSMPRRSWKTCFDRFQKASDSIS